MALFRTDAYRDGERLEIAGAPVRLKVSRRARRISLRLDRLRGEVVATAPSQRRLPEAAAFARERAGWMAARLAELPTPTPLTPGTRLTVFGRPCELVAGAGRAGMIEADAGLAIVAAGQGEPFAQAVIRVLKVEALRELKARTAHYCARIGRPEPRVRLADARTRWGSCTPAGAGREASIRYSWRLILAPVAVSDYVVAHECCHLIEANHGKNFWRLVHGLVGEEAPHRAWLRSQGAALHAFGR